MIRLALKSTMVMLLCGVMLYPAGHALSWVWNDVIWPDAEAVLSLHPDHFPEGSSYEIYAQDAMYRWNMVAGSQMYFYYNRDRDNCWNHDDNNSVVCWTQGDVGQNVLARAYYETWGGVLLEACDIVFDATVDKEWIPKLHRSQIEEDPKAYDEFYSFHAVMLHELGHCVGLDHNEELSTMNVFYSHAQYNLWSDDRAAARGIYGGGGTERNLTVSNWKTQGGEVNDEEPMEPVADISRTAVPPGETITIEYTIENSGTQEENGVRLGFYLSTNKLITTADTLIDADYFSFPYHSVGTFTKELTIPESIPMGEYYVGFLLDDLDQVPETDETDNRLAHWRKIFVGSDHINVPQDTPSISIAAAAIRNNGSISVYPGTYSSNISAHNKSFSITSVEGPEVTTITSTDIQFPFPPITFHIPALTASNTANISVNGFTLRYEGETSAVSASGSANLSITNSIIRGLGASGVSISDSAQVSFEGASIHSDGAVGISVYGSAAYLNMLNTTISSSTLTGLNLAAGSAEVENSTIANNGFSGIYAGVGTHLNVRNSIIAFNGAYGLNYSDGVSGSRTYNNVYGNSSGDYYGTSASDGEISADPLFGGDYRLNPDSSCIDAGDPASSYEHEPEPNGNRRNLGRWGNTEFAAQSIYNCQLLNVQVYPQCGSNGCEQNESIVMYAETQGDACPYVVDHFQIDAYQDDCEISYSGGDIAGISADSASIVFGTDAIAAQWQIPTVPIACRGKTLTATWAAIRSGGPPGLGTIVSELWASGTLTFRGSSGGPSCFDAAAPITMADGSTKAISSVKIGDEVLGWNEARSTTVPARVIDKMSRDVVGYYVLNEKIKVTGEHPFYVNGEWIPVKELQVGNRFRTVNGRESTLKSIEFLAEPLRVFNITVDEVHNYFAHSVLVHNKSAVAVDDFYGE